MNKKILSLILLGTIISSIPQTQKAFVKKPAVIVAATILGASIFRFYMKEPSGDPVRYSKEKLQEAIGNKDYKEILTQLWYFYDDGLVGRAGKRSSIRVSEDGKKLDIRPGRWPIGLGGYTHMYVPTLAKTLGFVLIVKEFLKKTGKGIDAWKDYLGFASDDEFGDD